MEIFSQVRGGQKNGNFFKGPGWLKKWKCFQRSGVVKKMKFFHRSVVYISRKSILITKISKIAKFGCKML
jgi:hypothetical protein